jgi:hypothetical protein
MKTKFKEGQAVLYQNGTTFGNEMPPVKEYLSAQQRDGKNLEAADIYKNTWLWLKSLNCEKFVNSQLIEQYATSVARWRQCEEAITKFGFLGKHPITGAPIQSPYVAMSQSFMKQANLAWLQIQDDVMEQLLRSRRK